KVEKILGDTKGVRAYSTIGGFSLLAYVSATYNGFFFVSLDPWEKRSGEKMEAQDLIAKLNGRFKAEIPEANVFAFLPPPIPGLGSAGRFSFWLQDRSGGPVATLDENLQEFL